MENSKIGRPKCQKHKCQKHKCQRPKCQRPKRQRHKSQRPKGSLGKMTKELRNIYLEVFDGLGGVQGFINWAKKNDDNLREFYKLHSKLIPLDISSSTGSISISINKKAQDV